MGDAPNWPVVGVDAGAVRGEQVALVQPPPGLDLPGPRKPEASKRKERATFDWGPLEKHPRFLPVMKALTADHKRHPLDLTRDLHDPVKRPKALRMLAELADAVSDGNIPDEINIADRNKYPLLRKVPDSVNYLPDGTSRKNNFVARCLAEDQKMYQANLGFEGDEEMLALDQYAAWLHFKVHPHVKKQIDDLAEEFSGATVTSRAKNADALMDKVTRMRTGSKNRPPRENYQTRDVIDCVGARITVEDTRQLQDLFGAIQQKYADNENGQILEIQNSYATPKEHNSDYRLITFIIGSEIDGHLYTYELQILTKRAAIAADLEHNTVYKSRIPTTDEDKKLIRQMQHAAACLDEAELVGESAKQSN